MQSKVSSHLGEIEMAFVRDAHCLVSRSRGLHLS